MTDTLERRLAACFDEAAPLDDARAAAIWRDVRRRTVRRRPRRPAPRLLAATCLAAGVIAAAAAVPALDGGGGTSTLTRILHPLGVTPATAAEIRRRALTALSQERDAILMSYERQPIVGQPGVISESTSWDSNSDGWAQRQRIVDGGVAVLETEQRRLPGDATRLEQIEYDPRSNTYVRTVSHPRREPPRAAESLRAAVQSCRPRVVGEDTIDGRRVLRLADTSEPVLHRVLYVDPQTYLPVRLVERPDGDLVTIDYTWLPASAAGQLWVDPPAGAREVSPEDFPVKD